MKKIIFMVIVVSSCILHSCIGQTRYEEKSTQFSLIIPPGTVLLDKNRDTKIEAGKYYIRIDILGPEKMMDGQTQFDEIKKNIEAGQRPDMPGNPASYVKSVKIDNIVVAIDFSTGSGPGDNLFEKRIIFVKKNKIIMISLIYFIPGPVNRDGNTRSMTIMQNVLQQYHQVARNKGLEEEDIELFIMNSLERRILQNQGKDQEIPPEAIELFLKFEELANSLKLE